MSDRPSTLQDFPYPAALQAIKDSEQFGDFADFQRHLVTNLPQNSPQTRLRYASLVVKWFFPDHRLDGLLPRVWCVYKDAQLLSDLTRVSVLDAEPVIARFATDIILPLPPGATLDATIARDFVTATYGSYKEQSYTRLLNTARHLGFLQRRDNQWVVAAIARPADAFLIVLHARMAPTPRIVRVAEILEQSFWRYLGFRQPDEVRSVLRDAHSAGLIARYSVVDELEQVTTRYSYETYVGSAMRL